MSSENESRRGDDHETRLSELDAQGMIMGLGTAAGVLAAGSAAAVWSRLPLDRTSKHLAEQSWAWALWAV